MKKNCYFILLLLISCSLGDGDIQTPDINSFVAEWRVEEVKSGEDDFTSEFEHYRVIFNSNGNYVLFTKDSSNIWGSQTGQYDILDSTNTIILNHSPNLENYILGDLTLTFFQRQFTNEGEVNLFFRLIKL